MSHQLTVDKAYQACRKLTAKSSKTFYLSSLLLPSAKRRGIWAIYAWCRRTDDLVDEPQENSTTLESLAAWETRLENIFAGNPQDELDMALVDTVKRFPLDIQPFRDMIAGQRMDLQQNRYETFDDLYLYCYRVAGTVGLMCAAVLGLEESAPEVFQAAIELGIANQLTNILRDVGEDANRNRIYIPLKELAHFDYTESELLEGVIDPRWRQLMQWQIQRARQTYQRGEKVIDAFSPDTRLSVALSLMAYRKILEAIERNDFDVFHHRAYISSLQKLMILPRAWWKVTSFYSVKKLSVASLDLEANETYNKLI